MPEQEAPQGMIDISKTAVTTIASEAINQCYGVVGMATKNLVNNIATRFTGDNRRGIIVTIEDEIIDIDIYVFVEYGVNIRAVAESIQHTVKFHVEKSLGMAVNSVNVFIQGLRMNKEQASS